MSRGVGDEQLDRAAAQLGQVEPADDPLTLLGLDTRQVERFGDDLLSAVGLVDDELRVDRDKRVVVALPEQQVGVRHEDPERVADLVRDAGRGCPMLASFSDLTSTSLVFSGVTILVFRRARVNAWSFGQDVQSACWVRVRVVKHCP